MLLPHIHTVGKYEYLEFNSVKSFNDFIDEHSMYLNEHNKGIWSGHNKDTLRIIKAGEDWFGKPVPSSLHELHEHSRFSGMHLLREVEPLILSLIHI